MTAVRILLAVSAAKGYKLWHLDIKSAYLNANLEEEIYMVPPERLTASKGKVCKLQKGLYGLKQAGRNWHILMSNWLLDQGFERCTADPCLFRHKTYELYVLLYVDDLLVAAKDEAKYFEFRDNLEARFELNELGELSWYLGMRIMKEDDGAISIDQEQFQSNVLKRFGMENAKNAKTPAAELRLTSAKPGERMIDETKYRELVGSIMWMANCTNPVISYSCNQVCRYMSAPTENHWGAAKRVLRYAAGKVSHLSFPNTDDKVILSGYSDADWAGDLETRRSTTGYIFFINGSPVSWCSMLQRTVAQSAAEAEYMALSAASLEAVYLRRLLNDFRCPQNGPTVIQVDNQAAMAMSVNPVNHKRTKHIEVKYHIVRELIEKELVKCKYVQSEQNVADIFTKPLGERVYERLRNILLHSRASREGEC